jgi:hypothetical protein
VWPLAHTRPVSWLCGEGVSCELSAASRRLGTTRHIFYELSVAIRRLRREGNLRAVG